ncbi:MAG: DUF6285 domain-containing protein [Ilumatobacteraceae bacterium]
MTGPHDAPTAAELVQAVREWIEGLGDTPANPFHARVAANVLGIVERELESGPEQARRHEARLAALGVADDRELASAIRNGVLDDRLDEVRDAVRDSVRDKLAVANPRYLDRSETG